MLISKKLDMPRKSQKAKLTWVKKELTKEDLLQVDWKPGAIPVLPGPLRYLKGSMIITTNLEFQRWTEIFSGECLTAAFPDKLAHKCHILEMNGNSYRFKESLKLISQQR